VAVPGNALLLALLIFLREEKVERVVGRGWCLKKQTTETMVSTITEETTTQSVVLLFIDLGQFDQEIGLHVL
jgi:hypothetical protein